ncbi:endonuclease V [Sphingobacterium spiritivorum]|uniref:Endonuclease V n=1 Tax=Sphingobacterium spiritivorum ATCC 33861 TaxID=525373 RepID=D7VRZ0_SPHSI|nr:endonuclease V [Sphingobacterium spiritivorum]EFK56541.1 deoxyribonuclease V [Sphingobacterium spiritivorum ATCC 33861]QQT35395.1 endonuclease V [Sphingobacterium spiritivorum]WQD32081.1 endonuclease V [Sphingobacterium spiritivorum]SUJ05612.1 Endonuclease V [Sphingobacterium spiritivorum]
MDYNKLTLPEATEIQEDLRHKLRFDRPDAQVIYTIGGADISYNKGSEILYAAIVILNYPDMTLRSYALATGHSSFPYIPGYLAFREVPALLNAWSLLPVRPDVLVLDGQGILHPRQMGIASHFGVLTGQATIGCAKNSLYGRHADLARFKGSSTPIVDGVKHIGHLLRTKEAVKPVFISPGYGLSVNKSLEVIRQSTGRYRIPEPTRLAHNIVNDFRTGKLNPGYHEVEQPLSLF